MSSLLESIKKKRQDIAAKQGRERPVKLSSPKNLIRLLPNWAGDAEGQFSQEFGQHFIKDKAGNIQAVYICTQNTFNKQCDVCAEIARHSAATTDEDMIAVLAEARPSSRILVNAIYMNGTHANAKTEPVLLELPVSVFNDILGIMENYLEDHDLNILSLKEGYDLVINKSGSGRETKYTVTPSPKARAIPEDTIKKARDLEAYAKQEYDAGLQKAIASLGAVMGGRALPPPQQNGQRALGQDKASPAKTAAQNLADTTPVDLDADLDAIDAQFTEVEAPTQVAKPNTPAANSAPAASIDDDLADLDDLLAAAS